MKNNFILFLISPFLGVIQAFKHHKEDWAKNSIWIFIIFYGFTMFRPEMMDSSRYVYKLQQLHGMPVSWDSFIANFYSEDSGTVDIYEPLITYFLSLFTDSGNILFAVFGIVFGYFYSRNLWLLIDLAKDIKTNKNFWMLFVCFACVIGFWNLNGVRMWTAAHMFFYGAFLLLVNGNRKGLMIAVLSILVHFSFVLPVAILVMFYVVKIPWRVSYFVFVSSFFISTLNVEVFKQGLESIAPEFLLPRVDKYTSDEYIEVVTDMNESVNWYVTYYTKSLSWVLVILFTIIYFSKKHQHASKPFYNLFGFSLLFISLGNITSLLPSGGRFLLIGQLFGVALLILYYVRFDNLMFRKWVVLLSPLFYFFVITSVRISLDTITFMTVLSNPIIAIFVDMPIPLINLIK